METIDQFRCPVTKDIFEDPWTNEHGFTYEKIVLQQLLLDGQVDPISRKPFSQIFPNRLLRQLLLEWKSSRLRLSIDERVAVYFPPVVPPLIEAVEKNDLSSLRQLLATGVNVEAVDEEGLSALHHALRREEVDLRIVGALEDAGAQRPRWSRDIFWKACSSRRQEVAIYLLPKTLEPAESNKLANVIIEQKLLKLVAHLLENNSSLIKKLIALTVKLQAEEMFSFFLSSSLSRELRQRMFSLAAENSPTFLKVLLNKSEDIVIGEELIVRSIVNGQSECCRLLVDQWSEKDELAHARLLATSIYCDDLELVKYFLDRKPDCNQGLPLFTALRFGRGAAVTLLLSRGANVQLRNSSGEGVLEVLISSLQGDESRNVFAKDILCKLINSGLEVKFDLAILKGLSKNFTFLQHLIVTFPFIENSDSPFQRSDGSLVEVEPHSLSQIPENISEFLRHLPLTSFD